MNSILFNLVLLKIQFYRRIISVPLSNSTAWRGLIVIGNVQSTSSISIPIQHSCHWKRFYHIPDFGLFPVYPTIVGIWSGTIGHHRRHQGYRFRQHAVIKCVGIRPKLGRCRFQRASFGPNQTRSRLHEDCIGFWSNQVLCLLIFGSWVQAYMTCQVTYEHDEHHKVTTLNKYGTIYCQLNRLFDHMLHPHP